MVKKTFFRILASLALALAFASCAGDPPAAETPPETPIPVESPPAVVEDPPVEAPPMETPSASEEPQPAADKAALDALESAKNTAAAARARVIRVGGDTAYPNDFQAAEKLLNEAQGMTAVTQQAAEDAASRYQAAAEHYDEIFQKALPAYAARRAAELASARQAALDAGWGINDPALVATDKAAKDAADGYGSGDFAAAEQNADNAALLYQAMLLISESDSTAKEMTDKELVKYDRNGFNAAQALSNEARSACAAGSGQDALKKAEDARARFALSLNTAWKNCAIEKSQGAGAERKGALDAKANVAVRDSFAQADTLYNQAAAAYQASRFEEAAGVYGTASAIFAQAREEAIEKRDLADAAIEAARQKAAESDSIAQNAEGVLQEGGNE